MAETGSFTYASQRFRRTSRKVPTSVVAAVVGAVSIGILTPTRSATPLEKVGLWAAGAVAGFVVVWVAVWLWHLLRAPFQQRDEARGEVTRLTHEIAQRDFIDFSLKADVEVRNDARSRGGASFSLRTILWITVTNNGPRSDFSARFDSPANLIPASIQKGLYEGGKVSWEDTTEEVLAIGYHGKAKLMLAECFRQPRLLMWFCLPATEAWSGKERAFGWILQPEVTAPTGTSVEFDVFVVNETAQKETRRRGRIVFGIDGSVTEFILT